MGLKNKAITVQKSIDLEQSGLKRTDYDQVPGFRESVLDDEKIFDILKKKGIVRKDELLGGQISPLEHQLSRYLLPDDLAGSTLPVDSDYSLNSRIEALINLIELCKELAVVETTEDLWESILFSLLGQIGAREAAIFIKDDNRFELKATKGFIFPDDMQLSKRSGVERILQKNLDIHYGEKILANISGEELNWFKSLQIELVVPVVHFEDLHGFIFVGKSIGMSDYTIEDLLYLKILGEIIGSFYSTIRQMDALNNQKILWNSREKIYQKYLYFQQQIQSSKDPQTAKSIFENYMNDTFAFQAYLLFILNEKDEYEIVSRHGLQEKSTENLKFSPEDSQLYRFQQYNTWFSDQSLLNQENFIKNFSKEDAAIFNEVQVLPLFFHGSLYGFFILLKANSAAPVEYMNYAQNIIITYFWYFLSHNYLRKVEKNLIISITDPLHGIKSEIERCEKKLIKNKTTYGILIVNIMNYNRLENLFGERYTKSTRKNIIKYCKQEFQNIKFISDLFNDKFLIIFENTDKSSLWLYDKNLNKQMASIFPEDFKRPLIHNRIYVRPDDKEKSLEQLLTF